MTSLRKGVWYVAGAWLLAVPAAAQNYAPRSYGPMPAAPFAPPPTPYAASPGQVSDSCYTGKGNCILLKPEPVGGPCRCSIPGYGQRKGVVQP